MLGRVSNRSLTEYALSIARAGNYMNVGTVEFLVQGSLQDRDARVVFLEVNPRIQVNIQGSLPLCPNMFSCCADVIDVSLSTPFSIDIDLLQIA
jgi:hypothetical protein